MNTLKPESDQATLSIAVKPGLDKLGHRGRGERMRLPSVAAMQTITGQLTNVKT